MHTLLSRGAFCLAALTVLAGPAAAQKDTPATWPQWRGPHRDCHVGGPKWPDSLQGERLKQLWRVELGPGYPGPVVAADRVFVAETREKKTEVVRALDRKTGKELWRAEWEGALKVPFFAARNGDWIRSTPAYDGECLYVAGMRDVLVCLDAATGKQRWRYDFPKELGTKPPDFGFVCSPLVDDTAVYVQAGASFAKLDKKTGKLLWQTLKDGGGMFGSAFSSPIFATIRGKKQLLVQTRDDLAGVDAASGEVLWKQNVPAYKGMNILTPTPFGDGVFTSCYQSKTFFYNIQEKDGRLSATMGWTAKQPAYMSSPVVIGDHVYAHTQSQRFACFNLKSGTERWVSDERVGQYCSMAVQGDRILALNEQGELLLLRANPERFELLDRRKVSDAETWGHIAVCGDEIFIRELNAIAAYRWR